LKCEPASVVTIQKAASTRSGVNKNAIGVSKNRFSKKTTNGQSQKTYITQQQLMSRTRNGKKNKQVI
jgi:hypothetical protein